MASYLHYRTECGYHDAVYVYGWVYYESHVDGCFHDTDTNITENSQSLLVLVS